MADKKISALPAATTPLAGTEVLPIVQSGVTDKVSVANLTAGRDISALSATLSNGNLVVGTAGKGIDFSANTHAAGMTSELLNDYEEGTWTPNQGAGLTVVGAFSSFGTYTKVGRIVTVNFYLTGATSVEAAQGNFMFTNLPFTVPAANATGAATNNAPSAGSILLGFDTSVVPVATIAATPQIFGSLTYSV